MKILTTLASYSGNSNPYIKEVIGELNQVSDVVVFSPEKINIDGVKTELRDKSLAHSLVFEPRQYILDHLDEYDYFLYNEDDILIKKESLLYAIEVNEKLIEDNIQNNVNFLRYELDNGVEEFVDLAPYNSVHTGGNGISDIIRRAYKIFGEYYFTPWNLHSGNFLLSRRQIQTLEYNNVFPTEAKATYCGILESGASGFKNNLRLLTPVAGYKRLMVHHMSNKYIFNPVKITTDLMDNFFKFIPEDVPV